MFAHLREALGDELAEQIDASGLLDDASTEFPELQSAEPLSHFNEEVQYATAHAAFMFTPTRLQDQGSRLRKRLARRYAAE